MTWLDFNCPMEYMCTGGQAILNISWVRNLHVGISDSEQEFNYGPGFKNLHLWWASLWHRD